MQLRGRSDVSRDNPRRHRGSDAGERPNLDHNAHHHNNHNHHDNLSLRHHAAWTGYHNDGDRTWRSDNHDHHHRDTTTITTTGQGRQSLNNDNIFRQQQHSAVWSRGSSRDLHHRNGLSCHERQEARLLGFQERAQHQPNGIIVGYPAKRQEARLLVFHDSSAAFFRVILLATFSKICPPEHLFAARLNVKPSTGSLGHSGLFG